jgi:signal transduction histidine kinase/CheY-like chemotaxis protein
MIMIKPQSVLTPEQSINSILEEAHSVRVNNLKKSIVLAGEALELSKQFGDNSFIAKSRSRLSFYYMINGEYDKALAEAGVSIGIFESLNDERGLADAKYTIGSVHYKRDDMHLGLQYVTECLSIYRKYNDYANIAKCSKVLGTIYEYFGDIESAIEANESAIAAADKAGDINMKTNAYNPLSGLYLNKNNIGKAMEIIEESIALKQQTGDTRGLAFAYYGRGKIYTKTKDYQQAEDDFNRAISIHTEMGEKLGIGMAYQKLGVMYMQRNEPGKAENALLKALELSEVYKIRMIKTKASYLLYEIFKNQDNPEKALQYLEIHHDEQEANVNNQTHQIINTYTLLNKMEARALEDKMQLERTEIMEKKDKAEYAAKVRQDFLSNMSHEIRTPLNAVITIANLLKPRQGNEEKQLLESLKFASGNLLLLINDILDFTKLETGKVELENRPGNIAELLIKIKNTYDSLAKEKGLELNLHIVGSPDEMYELDEMKLTQILGNLLSNAIKFTERGRVDLTVEKTGTAKEGVQLRFEVKDTGIGIPKDFLDGIFDTFTQSKSVTIKKEKGSGLGLAIVKKLAKLYGSEVKIDTVLGEGSVFYFDLILKLSDKTVVPVEKKNRLSEKLNVLLADDNNINLLVATKLLSRWGVSADCAKNGIEALKKAKEKKYDIILMDIHMPEMNGYDATIQIRQQDNINNTTPVYALTADIMAGLQQEYTDYFDGFLRKPIEVDQLYEVLSSIA